MRSFNIVEARIEDHRKALDSGLTTSVELVVRYLIRIATYDTRGGLNAFTVFNDKVFEEASASDDRRSSGVSPRPLEGIPYTLKDSYKYEGLTVTNGSPALQGLMSNEDSYIAAKLREAGAVLIGKTNMPPMAAGGMQRGLYSRAESPYNTDYLTAAFSSGSSNGAATSIAASMAAFGMGSETVSSGRSAASNNALVCYTPSRGVLSCRGLWPLDRRRLLAKSTARQNAMPHMPFDWTRILPASLAGTRIAVPRMYIGESDPAGKPTYVSSSTISIWNQTRADLESLGATVIPTEFPFVTKYEDDSVSGEANNVVDVPPSWQHFERSGLIAKVWDDFLIANKDPYLSNINAPDPHLLFPKPEGYIPDLFLEHRNWISYASLPSLAQDFKDISIYDLPGLSNALVALEAQRKRDLEDWLETNNFDFVVFPSQGDVGRADLEFSVESARHALQNGVKYSNGNRAIRHLGVPTVSVPMGVLEEKGMPVNLTFIGRAYSDEQLLKYAWAFEEKTKKRIAPPLTPTLPTDAIERDGSLSGASKGRPEITANAEKIMNTGKSPTKVTGTMVGSTASTTIQVYLDGKAAKAIQLDADGTWEVIEDYEFQGKGRLSWKLEPMPPPPAMVVVVAASEHGLSTARLLWV